jgi:Cu2+-exporting ATPase
VKDGRALEKLKSIDTLVFDKTGTLTLERPHIVGIHVTGEYTEIEVLSLAATAEYRQVHPIAQAILTAAEERGIELPVIDTAHYEIGYGVKVQVGDLEVMVGSQRFMLMENIRLPSSLQAEIERCKNEGRSLVYVAADGQLAGLIELDATLRPEARAIVDWLRQRGLELYILSGDQEPPTQRLARELSMDGYFANILPEGKAELIEQLQAEGRSICFIGDGINDAIALRQADVSISFRGAANIASDSAQIVLMEDHLDQLRVLFELIQAYDRNLATNYQQSVVKSLIAAAAVLILPLKFLIVEGLWVFTFAKGITLATRPLLKMPTSQSLDSSAAENVERLVRDGDPHL